MTTRDHNRTKDVFESRREFNRLAKRVEKRMEKKVRTFPCGEYAVIMRCNTINKRTGEESEHVKVLGNGELYKNLDRLRDTILYTPIEHPQETIDEEATAYLDMPSSASSRSQKLRLMLQKLWVLEGLKPTKHIYNAVKKGSPGFTWWAHLLPGIPFTNVAVEGSEESKRIYEVVAPRLYTLVTGKDLPSQTTDPIVSEPIIEKCARNSTCTRPNGHVGACNRRGAPGNLPQDPPQDPRQDPPQDPRQDPPQDPRQDPPQEPEFNRDAFYAMVHEKTPASEPFRRFVAGDIATLKEYIGRGHSLLESYRIMGASMDTEYVIWARQANGILAWKEIQDAFPTYLDQLSLPQEIPVPKQKAPRKQKRKAKTSHVDEKIAVRKTQSKKRHKAARKKLLNTTFSEYV